MKQFLPLRILAVISAAFLMTAYVVYSRQLNRSTAPGSKTDVLRRTTAFSASSTSTNARAPLNELTIASSSKSIAPAVQVRPPLAQPQPDPSVFAYGSKSAAPAVRIAPAPQESSPSPISGPWLFEAAQTNNPLSAPTNAATPQKPNT